MCSNTRELINLHQKSFIYCVKLNKLIKCSATMVPNYHTVQVMWCKHIPRSLSGTTSVSQPFCTCTVINWYFEWIQLNINCSLFCFVLCMCVHVCVECVCVLWGTVGYVGHIQFLNPCLLHSSTEFSWTLIENCHEGKRRKCLLSQSACCVLSMIVKNQSSSDSSSR